MPEEVDISICIPAYKRPEFLRRLLDSIVQQSFRNFEVIVTDDSPGKEVELLSEEYASKMNIRYHRNEPAAGTPENWNIALDLAQGSWIKIMHDDDWFSSAESLAYYAQAISEHSNCSFFFSAYQNVILRSAESEKVFASRFRLRMLRKNPVTLLATNVIGPPSSVIYKKDLQVEFDKNLKWLVDIEFYLNCLYLTNFVYIDKVLVNIGIGEQQVTTESFRQGRIEIPENLYVLNKIGIQNLKNILVYDAWWRLLRNLGIKKEEEIYEMGNKVEIPAIILSMLNWQKRLPRFLLKVGILSKSFMLLHYLFKKYLIPYKKNP